MRFLDLDLDFFLNKNAYYSGADDKRLGPDYRPWSPLRVKRFLEVRCGLSSDIPIPGRTISSHDLVIEFWRRLIETGKITIPFEVTHIDAHPDLSVRGGLHLASGRLYLVSDSALQNIDEDYIHSGNYLTFAIAQRWISSLVWIPLEVAAKGSRGHVDADKLPSTAESGIPFVVLPWRNFKTTGPYDYMSLSKSPAFTPPESDALVPVIEKYIRQI